MSLNDKHLPQKVYGQYTAGRTFNEGINLYATVEQNENFYLGKHWEGVEANGLPTPVFPMIEQIVGYLVSSMFTDNIKIQASPMDVSGVVPAADVARACEVVNGQLERIVEREKLAACLRRSMRMCALDGDACLYAYWDDAKPSGQLVPGDIAFEMIENTRVLFGNPYTPLVDKQPYIIIERRETVEDVQRRARRFKGEPDRVKPDTDELSSANDSGDDSRVTVILKLWREYNDDGSVKTVKAYECTKDAVVRPEWDIKIKVYPIAWMNWSFVLNRYHGEAAATAIIPNQIFLNKMYALSMLSLMTTAYPKVIYDKTRVAKWDNRVGAAIGVNGGDVDRIAKIMDPAQISPQVSQFIDSVVSYTKDFKGASDAALGNVRPDNTSAIVAVQRAAAMPRELTKQDAWQFVEDFSNILVAMMGAYYGVRYVDGKDESGARAPVLYDFSILQKIPMTIKLDVGAASFWSETAGLQTMDNMLMNGRLEMSDYIERLPRGLIPKQQELVDKMLKMQAQQEVAEDLQDIAPTEPIADVQNKRPIPIGRGNSTFQRAIANGAGV